MWKIATMSSQSLIFSINSQDNGQVWSRQCAFCYNLITALHVRTFFAHALTLTSTIHVSKLSLSAHPRGKRFFSTTHSYFAEVQKPETRWQAQAQTVPFLYFKISHSMFRNHEKATADFFHWKSQGTLELQSGSSIPTGLSCTVNMSVW